jgi:hypothetical protein
MKNFFQKNEALVLGLVNSALEIQDGGKIYEFSQWLNSSEFINSAKSSAK